MDKNQHQDFQRDAQVKMHAGEIDIDAGLVQRLLREQFPQMAEMPITLVRSTGTVNAVYRLGDEFCIRSFSSEGFIEVDTVFCIELRNFQNSEAYLLPDPEASFWYRPAFGLP